MLSSASMATTSAGGGVRGVASKGGSWLVKNTGRGLAAKKSVDECATATAGGERGAVDQPATVTAAVMAATNSSEPCWSCGV